MKHWYVVATLDERFKSEVIASTKREAKRKFREKNGWIFQCLGIKPKKLIAYKEVV